MIAAGRLHAAFRSLPIGTIDEILPGTTLLLAPHPDDESLGCGGLIASLCAAGRPPLLVVLTDGAGSHPGSPSWPPERLRAARRDEVLHATALLGLDAARVRFLALRDTRSPHDGPAFEEAVRTLSAIQGEVPCAQVLTSWLLDPHCDHVSAALLGRALAARHGLTLLYYPVWGWLIDAETVLDCPAPEGWRFDAGPHLRAKAAAIAAHRTQYGGLIQDDPAGFVLPRALLSVFEGRYETVLRA